MLRQTPTTVEVGVGVGHHVDVRREDARQHITLQHDEGKHCRQEDSTPFGSGGSRLRARWAR